MNNINPTKNESEQFLLHWWHPSCYSFNESYNKTRMKYSKESKRNTFALMTVVCCIRLHLVKIQRSIKFLSCMMESHPIKCKCFMKIQWVDLVCLISGDWYSKRVKNSTKESIFISCNSCVFVLYRYFVCLIWLVKITANSSSIKIWLCCYL